MRGAIACLVVLAGCAQSPPPTGAQMRLYTPPRAAPHPASPADAKLEKLQREIQWLERYTAPKPSDGNEK